ncbi:MAG: NAD-dependent epimerase/dehydratase family protein [Planctomycetes bacterium]|nr:NAD-dependent epimerase/dehydratase family protein [Planctomycetota bacterium]MBU1517390.1 NAD-dependent epimerase/dehydratase family protein [Planctomycetota bacterium]MBU2597304.1 NAD-dependent epimerase/dehydratase family protein [Planctomycetota bacterium]
MMDNYKSYYKGKTILITGGAGAIGCNLTRVLSALGAERIIVLDDLSSAELWNIPNEKNVQFIQGSVIDQNELKRVFNLKPTIVFHLAALFANQNSLDYPEKDLEVNGLGILRTLQFASMSGKVERFVYTSSGCSIYGSHGKLPLTEDQVSLFHTTPYQITKMLGELYCNFFFHQYGLPVVKTRFFNSYGPGEVPGQYRNVIPNFIYWALLGKPLVITGNPQATRDFAWVLDLVDALLRSGYCKEAIGEAYNLSEGKEIEIGYLAKKIVEYSGSKSEIIIGSKRKWDTKDRLLASTEKAYQLIGFKPSMDFDEGLKIAIAWMKSNLENIKLSAKFGPGISSANVDVIK